MGISGIRLLVTAIAAACSICGPAAEQQAPPIKAQQSFAECVDDPEPYLVLDYKNFDQGVSPDGKEWGWREISNKPGCETAAADLIEQWTKRHESELSESRRQWMVFHEGQVRAMGGQFKRGAALVEAGRGYWNTAEGKAYVDAILAFLHNDRTGLLAARERLMAVPKPKNWERTQEQYRKLVDWVPAWPQNIESVDKLIECFGKGYTGGWKGDCEWRPAQ